MERSQRLKPIVKHKYRVEDQVAQQLKHLEERKNAALAQLDALKAYRQDYETRIRETGQSTVKQIQELRRFILSLDTTIQQQQAIADDAHRNWLSGQDMWIKARRQAEALEQVADELAHMEANRRDQMEQDAEDELVMQKHLQGLDRTN